MPQPTSSVPKSLEQLCVQSIVDNLEKFKSSSSSCEEEELGCFAYLPSRFLVSIFDVAKARLNNPGLKVENLLDLFITSRLDTLDLRQRISTQSSPDGSLFFTKLNNQTVLHLLRTAALRHSPLESLLMPSSAIPSLVFKDLLPAFPNLKLLDVSIGSGKTINDEFLALLPTCCPNLEELRLFWCTGVTDVGIGHLCGSQEGADGVPGCKSLVRLNVDGTRVTRHGARLVLEHFQRLQIFDWPSTLQIAAEMHQTDGARQLNLHHLNATSGWANDNKVPYVRGSLIGAVRLCPLVVDVNISGIPNLADEDFTSLLNLECLKKLTLKCCPEISFNGGLMPILKKFGPSSLESLTLSRIREVNIGSIVEFCSELREMRLEYNERYSPARPGWRPSPRHRLPHLRSLTIEGCLGGLDLPGGQPSHEDLSLLLSSATDLEWIVFHRLRHLSDEIVDEAIVQHGFPHLKSFQVEDCRRITKRVVDRLLELDNPLSLIGIVKNHWNTSCRERNPHECPDPAWKEAILEKNLDLTIHYCEG